MDVEGQPWSSAPADAGKILGHKLFVQPVQLLDLEELTRCWPVTQYAVYQAVNRHKLQTVGRPGHQRYYLRNEVEQVFGPALIDPDPNRDVRRYRSGSEYTTRAA